MADGRVKISRIIHTIHATHDIYGCRLLYQDALGGLVFADRYLAMSGQSLIAATCGPRSSAALSYVFTPDCRQASQGLAGRFV